MELLHARFEAVRVIGEYKRAHQLDVAQHSREAEILNHYLTLAAKVDLPESFVRQFVSLILEASRRAQLQLAN